MPLPPATPPREPVGISPRVDCVFQALLGDPQHTNRLLDFLNAVLSEGPPIVEVTITNPVKILDLIGDKAGVVDVLAVDAKGRKFQVEMQSRGHAGLKERMLYGWAGLYQRQSRSGRNYATLRPVVSIWLVDENCFRGVQNFHHRFAVMSPAEGIVLSPHLDIHVLELDRWRQGGAWTVPPAIGRWMSFFAGAEEWSEVPAPFQSPILEEAMTVLQTFRTNQTWNDAYHARLDYEMLQATLAEEMERQQRELAATREESERQQRELAATNNALAATHEALARKEAEAAQQRAEVERLRALLQGLGGATG